MGKYRFRKWLALGLLMLLALPVGAGQENIRVVPLLLGVNTDSTEQATKWFECMGAQRVVIRTFTSHAAFTGPGSGDVDSLFSDSLISFNVLVSDSVLFMARDSLGTLVTSRSTIPHVPGSHGEPYPMCADSMVVQSSATSDTAITAIAILPTPINKALRAPSNGSGLLSFVRPAHNTGTLVDSRMIIAKRFMRIRFTPLRRSTSVTVLATVPNKTNGLKGVRMYALVYTENK